MANRWRNNGNSNKLFFGGVGGAPKSLQMVTTTIKSKTIVPWKKSYDQAGQHIKKQRHYFANKGLSSQSYGLSSNHVWMWELDYQEGWATPVTAALQPLLSITYSRSLLKLMAIESVKPSNHLILCCSLRFPPSIFPSIRVFSNNSVLHIRWPKYWNFSFSICPSNECSGLISIRMDWLDLLAVEGTLKSLL